MTPSPFILSSWLAIGLHALLAHPARTPNRTLLIESDCERALDLDRFFGRAFGAMLTGIAAMHFLDGPSASLCKQMAITAALILYPMVLCLSDSENFKPIWKPQIVVHLALTYFLSKAGGLI